MPPAAVTASRSLAIRRRRIHALGDRATRSESVHGPTVHEPRADLLIDQGLERIDRLVAPQPVDVDRDVIRAETGRAAQLAETARPSNRTNRPPRNESGCASLDRLERHPFLGEDQLQARRRLPQEQRQRRQDRRVQFVHAGPPGAWAAHRTKSRVPGSGSKRKPPRLGAREEVIDPDVGRTIAPAAAAIRPGENQRSRTGSRCEYIHRPRRSSIHFTATARQPRPPAFHDQTFLSTMTRTCRPAGARGGLRRRPGRATRAPGARRPRRPSPVKACRRERQPPRRSRARDRRRSRRRASPPTGPARPPARPARTSILANRPLPQPRSRTRLPASGPRLVDDAA